MIKFLFIIVFIFIIILKNIKVIFYYNICFILRFFFLFNFIYKDIIWIRVGIIFGHDFFSFYILILRLWILGLIFIVIQLDNNKIFKDNYVKKIIIFMFMLIILLIFFSSINLIVFYLIFELRLIPTFIIIIYWGINFERLKASYYLLIYTIFISLPLLIYIIKLLKFNGSLDLNLLAILINYEIRLWDYIILFIAFFIKLPIYLFHIWLPKAHVEAPVYGSIILASVLLKLGRYGILRFLDIFFIQRVKFNYLIISIGIIGRLLVRLICLIQIDIKRLVAYSSVVHINILICSILTLIKIGFIRSYILIISHGLCSSGLFFIVNLYYERSYRRLIFFNKGILNIMPSLRIWWFFLCSANFSFPFSLNFIREIYIIRVLIGWDLCIIIYLIIICFFRRAYSLYLYSYIQHGSIYMEEMYINIYLKDYIILLIHIQPLVLLILNLCLLY